jgi:subtilisin family serine protease
MIALSSQLSTWENGSYATVSGTSMACPHVSGVVALMISANPSATPAQIFSALTSSSENPSTTGSDSNIGYGVINALAAVKAISSYTDSNNTPNEVVNDIEIDIDDNAGSGGTGSDSDCVELVITIRTDRYASDSSHWLQTGAAAAYLFYQSDFDSFETYRETNCVDPNVCTTYNVRDSFGDGISGEGVEIKYGGVVVFSGGDFGVGGIKTIGNC